MKFGSSISIPKTGLLKHSQLNKTHIFWLYRCLTLFLISLVFHLLIFKRLWVKLSKFYLISTCGLSWCRYRVSYQTNVWYTAFWEFCICCVTSKDFPIHLLGGGPLYPNISNIYLLHPPLENFLSTLYLLGPSPDGGSKLLPNTRLSKAFQLPNCRGQQHNTHCKIWCL